MIDENSTPLNCNYHLSAVGACVAGGAGGVAGAAGACVAGAAGACVAGACGAVPVGPLYVSLLYISITLE